MSLISWSKLYSVNHLEIDTQHKKLVDILNNLHDSMRAGKGKEVLASTIADLLNYTTDHFTFEEKYMKQINYPSYLMHKSEHDNFIIKTKNFYNDFSTGKSMMTVDILSFLKDWLINHIQKADKEYSKFANK